MSKIFDNCLIEAPDGVALSRCGIKKAQWYLDRNLAHLVNKEPYTIRLNFEPSGRNGINDPLLMMGKPNICVVCGTDEDLTKHHIVPYSFNKYMPLEYKVDIIRDIFPLCRPCHHRYEQISNKKRIEIAIHLLGKERVKEVFDSHYEHRHVGGAANALLKHGKNIPVHRQQYLKGILQEATGQQEFTEEDLDRIAWEHNTDRWENVSKEIVARLTDLDAFTQEWREHFMATMKPRYMPEEWSADRKMDPEAVWVPDRIKEQPHEIAVRSGKNH